MEPEAKTDKPMEVPAAPRARWRRIVRRVFKYGFLASLLCVICIAVIAWMRSATWNDRVELDVAQDRVILLRSKQRELTMGVFKTERGLFYQLRDAGRPGFPRPMRHASNLLKQPPLESEKGFVTFKEKVKESKASIGVGIVSEIQLFETHHPPINWTMSPNTYLDTGYSGYGLALPHWMLLFVLGTIFTVIMLGRRFTLRAFFIWVTIVCVILAIAVRTSGDANQDEDRSTQNGA